MSVAHIQWCANILRRCREMVPNKEQLQIEIFVTNHQAKAVEDLSSMPSGTEDNMLQPPTPRFARDGRPRPDSVASQDSLDSTITANSITEDPQEHPDGDLGTHVLDYTNFDGEEDTRTAAEATLSKKVKKEGRLKRARSRKIAAAVSAKLQLEEKRKSMKELFSPSHDDEPLAAPHPRYAQTASGSGSNTPLTSTPSGTPRALSPMGTPKMGSDALLRPPLFADPTFRSSVAESMFSRGSVYDDSRSVFGAGDDMVVEIDEEEMEDITHVADLARPGKPKLDKILSDEVEKAQGEVVVACCGPTSLNAAMRKFVADQLSPAKVWKGDMSGSIKLGTFHLLLT